MQTLVLLITLLSTSYKAQWYQTEFEIPLNENVNEYFELPYAILLTPDGKKIDEEHYYERGVNRTSLSVVNSKHVKTFKIDYRVTYPSLGFQSVQTITFKIIDNISPTIISADNIQMPVKQKLLTEKELISTVVASDNYYDAKELTIRVKGLSNVNINYPGEYLIIYEVVDPSFNIAQVERTYEIINTNYPTIKYSEPLIMEYGKNFNHLDYFKYVDEYDDNLEIIVDISFINFQLLGKYPLYVEVTNRSGKTTYVETELNIVDKTAPELLIVDKAVINVNSEESINLEDYIIKVFDNYDVLTEKDVTIVEAIDYNTLGKYTVTYQVKDSSGNVTTQKLTIEVKDLSKPTISLKEPIIIPVFTLINYWVSYFDITDNYDHFSDLTIKFADKNIDYKTIGQYWLEVEVEDASKNKLKTAYEVTIVDNQAPIVTQYREIIVKDFSSKNADYYKEYFLIEDNYDEYKNITVTVRGDVNYQEVNEYLVEFIFTDSSMNETVLETSIYVLDLEPPVITLNNDVYTYYIGDETPSFNGFIKSLSDNYTKENELIITIEENINFAQIGQYIVKYIVVDQMNNYQEKNLIFLVDKRPTTLLEGQNISIKINDDWDFGEGIATTENVVKIVSFPAKIDTSKLGIVEILYIAYDERGNSEEYLQSVTIVEGEKEFNKKYYLIILVDIIGAVSLVYLHYQQKSSNSHY